jgi:chromosome segregation ATPase
MFFCALYLLSALSISAIAAYFSVIGLATIFPGSMGAIIIMGGVLEIGKIVTAIWLHRNWKSSPFLVKTYLSFATLVLMGITSMGIFGFLSRAHIEHQTSTDKAVAAMQVIDNKITRENDFIQRQQENIDRLKDNASAKQSTSRLDIDLENSKVKDITDQLNKDITFEQNRINEVNNQVMQLDSALSELENSSGGLFSNKKTKIEELKNTQEPLRKELTEKISTYNNNISGFRNAANKKIETIEQNISKFREDNNQKDTAIQPQIEEYTLKISQAFGRIDELEAEKIGFSDNARQLEAEVGPVKYVAEAIADFTGKEFDISQAVRIVIIILVLVFDPLAILLVIAANISIEKYMPVSKRATNKAKEQFEALKKSISDKTSELNQLKDRIESSELFFVKTDEKIQEKESKIKNLEAEAGLKYSKIEELKKEIIDYQDKSDEKRLKLNELTEKLLLEESSIKKEQEKIKLDRENIISQQNTLSQKQDEVNQGVLKLKQEAEDLAQSNIKLKAEKDKIKSEIEKLSSEAEAQEKLIESLKNSYQETKDTSELKNVFSSFKLNETVSMLENSEKIVCISDAKGRVHQFFIPAEHFDLSHKYYHSVVKKLSLIDNIEYLPHEYKEEMQKFIRNSPPKYNVLT